MAETIKISATKKEKNGKGSARAVRTAGRVPAIIYGGKLGEQMVSVASNEFLKVFNRGNIHSRLFEIDLEGKPLSALVRAVQLDPVKDFPLHIDFQEIGKDTIIKVFVHVKVINEDKSPGLKKGGVLNVAHRTIPFYCHPTNIPEHIIVDVGSLEIGRSVHIEDLNLGEGMTAVDTSNFVVVSLSGRAEEKVEAPVVAAAAVTPAAGAAPAATTK